MPHNVSSTLMFACAATCVAIAVLSARLARGVGTKYFRSSSAASFSAAIFCLGAAVFEGGASSTIAIWAVRGSLSAACLHQASWLHFLVSWTERKMTRVDRTFFFACLVCAVLVLIPGVGTGDRIAVHRLVWLGGTRAEPALLTFGHASMMVNIACQFHILRSAVLSQRANPQARALALAFVFLIIVGVTDGVTVAVPLPLPLLVGLGFSVVSVGVGTVIVGAAVETSRRLEAKTLELERARLALVERERLAGLGELAAVVAHEVRNPLAVVFNALAGLRRLPPHNADETALLGIIEQEADRLKRLVVTLLDAVRPFELQVGRHRVAGIVADSIALAARHDETRQAGVRVIWDIAEDEALDCDNVLLAQALSNLVANALDAPGRTSPVHVRLACGEGPGVLRFEVRDDGEGVAEADRPRIFTPFFTTRATGTGLGLTLVKRIAEAHRGTVSLDVSTERGAKFVLTLPKALPP